MDKIASMLAKAMNEVRERPSRDLFFAGASWRAERSSQYFGTFFARIRKEHSFAPKAKSPSLGKKGSLHGI
jgi:hypothetical protein